MKKEGRVIELVTSCVGTVSYVKQIVEGKIEGGLEVAGKQGRRRKLLLYDLKETIGNWKLKEEALDYTVWRTRFGSGYGPVIRQPRKCTNAKTNTARVDLEQSSNF
jgi:hypothetical protein